VKTPVLITAGATRNPIDSMRCITANASGRTGVWLAENLHADKTYQVHLLGSPMALLRQQSSYSHSIFSSTSDLMKQMKDWILTNPNGVVIHSSAVGDFEVVRAHNGKISSGKNLVLQLQPTPKILDHIKQWSPSIFLVSFKASAPETAIDELEVIATNQRIRSQSDIVFANILGNIHQNILLCCSTSNQYFAERSDAMQTLLKRIKRREPS
jgi:phosphopantothenoylcysteine decarboxylase / phosphopantothenate---cysteine ligase